MAPKHAQASRSDGKAKAIWRDQLPSTSSVSPERQLLVLPAFVDRRQDPRPGEFLSDYWAVNETGDWERDVEIGNAHARDAVRFIRAERAPHVLNWIASEMVHKRRFGPIEVGFFHEIGALIVRTRR